MKKLSLVVLGIIFFTLGILISECVLGRTVELNKDTLQLTGPVDAGSAGELVSKLMLSDRKEEVIFISSPGGSVYQGLRLIEVMRRSGKKFVCVADFAASMAFSIFQQCDYRYIMSFGVLMQHQSSWGVQGNNGTNKAIIKLFDQLGDSLDTFTSTKLKMTRSTYENLVVNDLWLYGDSSLSYMGYRFADKVVHVVCTKELINSERKITTRGLFGYSTSTVSGCPLITTPVTDDSNRTLDSTEIKELNMIK